MRKLVLILLAAMVFTIPWENMIVFPMFGTLSRSIGLTAAILGVITVLFTGQLRPLRAIHFAMGAFVLWAFLSLGWSLNASSSAFRLVTYVQLVGMAWLIWEFAATRARQLWLMYAYILGGVVGVGTQMISLYGAHLGARFGVARIGGGGLDLNDFSLLLSISIPMAVYCAMNTSRGNKLLRLACWAYCPVAGFGILLTGSRMGFIILIVAGGLIILSQLAARPAYGLIPLAIAGLLVVKAPDWLPESTLGRLTSTGKELRSGTWSSRMHIWEAGLKAFKSNPILGTGTATFALAAQRNSSQTLPDNANPHNAYLGVAVELGAIGLVLFGIVGIIAVFYSLKMKGQERFLWLILLMSWALGAFVLGIEGRKLVWFLLGLLASQSATLETLKANRAAQLVRRRKFLRWMAARMRRQGPVPVFRGAVTER